MVILKFFRSERGEIFVKEFLDALPGKLREKVFNDIWFLKEHSFQAMRPRAAFLRDKIYELRTALGHLEVRILYFFDKDIIILTHGFFKKSDAVPPHRDNKGAKYKGRVF